MGNQVQVNVRDKIQDLVNEIHDTVENLIDLADNYNTKNVSEKTLKRVFYPLFNELERKTIELMTLLKPYGVKDRDIRYIVMAIKGLKSLSVSITDPEQYDYWLAGIRFIESVISLANGETPYCKGAPDEAIGAWLVWQLMKLSYKLIRIFEIIKKMEKQGAGK